MSKSTDELSRRRFLAGASSLGAVYTAWNFAPLSALAPPLVDDPRIAQQPIVDKGYASIRKIGEGLYATIADRTKGLQARCNGGFLVGRDAAMLIEGLNTTIGAQMQLDTLRTVTQLPVRAAIDTHWHFDHTLGNPVYGGAGIPIWAHADVAARMSAVYGKWQTEDLATFIAPWEKRASDATTDSRRDHAQSDVRALTGMFNTVSQSILALPNHPLELAKMPMEIDLGGLKVVIEAYDGHSGTDLILRVPDQKVVYTGDILFRGLYPVNINGDPVRWRASLAHLATFDKDTLFVPGHGQICGQEGVAEMRACFDDIAEQAEKSYNAGVPVDVASERYVIPERYKNYLQLSWGFTIGRTYQQFYAAWSGKQLPILNY